MSTQEHRPLVVSGPSGSGKSTLLARLFAEFPETFGFSVSHTTRAPRAGEENGKQYHFIARSDFQKMIDDGSFIEHAEFSGNLYGTSVEAVKKVADEGKVAVLDVDMQGVKSVKKTDLNARSVFIRPPTLEVLEQRLRGRNTETEEAVMARLEIAKGELAFADEPGSHDFVIVNDDLEEAYKKLKDYVVEFTGAKPMVSDQAPDSGAKDAQVVAASASHLAMTPVEPIPGESKKSTEKLADEKTKKSTEKLADAEAKKSTDKLAGSEAKKSTEKLADDKAPVSPSAATPAEAGASGDAVAGASGDAGAAAAAPSTSTASATTDAKGKSTAKEAAKKKEKQKSKSCLIL